MLPRVMTKRMLSGDQLKSNIWPETNLVNCFGTPHKHTSSQMFGTLSRISKYCKPFPLRHQRGFRITPDTLNVFRAAPPPTSITTKFHAGVTVSAYSI